MPGQDSGHSESALFGHCVGVRLRGLVSQQKDRNGLTRNDSRYLCEIMVFFRFLSVQSPENRGIILFSHNMF